ncbi:MAG: hypothetical protein FJX45_12240 [Alphaproteobacteria bacterium]|nr:hypothetical protein [Alphaproteobacteria bacterium]
MATDSIALGRLADALLKVESSYGVAPGGNYQRVHFYKASLKESTPLEGDPIIGSGNDNFRDEAAIAPALSEHGGGLELPLCMNQIGDWLTMVFGAATSTGTTNRTHVFKSGLLTLPSYALEIKPIASDYRMHTGLAAKSLTFDLADAAGVQRMMLDVLGYGEAIGSSSGGGIPVAARTYAPFKATGTGTAVKLDSVAVGKLLSAKFTYETGLTQDRYIDTSDRFGAGVLSENAQFSGELRVRYAGPTYDSLAEAETEKTLGIEFVVGANNSLILTSPSVRFARSGVAIEGPGGIEQTIQFRARQTASAPMLTATLKNQIATYP